MASIDEALKGASLEAISRSTCSMLCTLRFLKDNKAWYPCRLQLNNYRKQFTKENKLGGGMVACPKMAPSLKKKHTLAQQMATGNRRGAAPGRDSCSPSAKYKTTTT